MTSILSKIKNPWQALYLMFNKKPKFFIMCILVIIIGIFLFFNLSYNKKDGVVIKPSVKVEVKK